ncbi:sugar phosphate permease [Glaciihabitans tibetensis]|uniref:Sugar phosphate permease n=1 Tax=Glaciihabitans tibetensis TaxID=1266600 RepID=A0A2T0VEF8_9MICO|nr:MFS transporter [Glaciihabitans tibetensis]PRY68567.1 sugar phosphate permease [Glaciihabitans tibetensis]
MSPASPRVRLPGKSASGVVSLRRTRLAVSAAYAAQGLGYAVVVTALPALKGRQAIDDTAVSLIILLVCIAAAAGSVCADRLAARSGSGTALALGLILQTVALAGIAAPVALPVFVAAFAVYGVGLGMVDAAGAMQGVLVQRRFGASVMAGFFACYTAAAIVGALLMSVLSGSALPESALGASVALVAAAVVALAVSLVCRGWFDARLTGVQGAASAADGSAAASASAAASGAANGAANGVVLIRRPPLPRRGIAVFGLVVLAAFVVDSAVSTWSTVYLHDVLLSSAAVAPLGYAAYQAAILVTRLGADRVVRRYGRVVLAIATALLAMVGLALVAAVPSVWAAVFGFALAGFGVGALVPLAFSAAGELDPERSDEIIARVNLFNYAGAVLGAVLVGLLAEGPGLATGFLIPLALLIPVVLFARRFITTASTS